MLLITLQCSGRIPVAILCKEPFTFRLFCPESKRHHEPKSCSH